MRIPLFNRLKKQLHRDIAMLQDEVVDIVYSISGKAVLHGGTAIWRCYYGDRFSEDLDFYIPSVKEFRELLVKSLESRGLKLLKFKKTQNTIFAKISDGKVEVRLEIAFRKPKSFEVKQYERINGSFVNVFTLSPEELVLEKIFAYSSRKLARDIYDIFMLSAIADNKKIGVEMQDFLKGIERPIDEKNLKAIVFSGAVPSFEQMLVALKRRFSK